jgi:DNA-binding GntR family transcriptional regulator
MSAPRHLAAIGDTVVLDPIETVPLKGKILQVLREAILSGRLKPGERLNESRIARQLQMSRVPVREALQRLEEQGLVVSVPRKGMFVVSLSEEESRKINAVRLVLEPEALILCKAHITPARDRKLAELINGWDLQFPTLTPRRAAELEFQIHRTIWDFSENEFLAKTLVSLVGPLYAHRVIHVKEEGWEQNSHVPFLEFIRGESSRSAEQIVLTHIKYCWKEPEKYSHIGLDR